MYRAKQSVLIVGKALDSDAYLPGIFISTTKNVVQVSRYDYPFFSFNHIEKDLKNNIQYTQIWEQENALPFCIILVFCRSTLGTRGKTLKW